MFVAEAIADFSASVVEPQKQEVEKVSEEKQVLNNISKQSQNHPQQKIEEGLTQPKGEKNVQSQNQQQQQKQQQKQIQQQDQQGQKQEDKQQEQEEQQEQIQQQPKPKKVKRDSDHQQQYAEEQNKLSYLEFQKGDKILVRQTDESGWWFGNVIGQIHQGYFPSTFVQCGSKAPPPPAPPASQNKDWMSEQLQKMHQGPVQSQYYQGIIGHKLVKIDDKNKNLLKGNYVKYNEATGLASVPIKSQAPNAKAVRQMGYYFDYHQWIDERNNVPDVKARPDIRRKKQKKLNLKLFGEDNQKANKKKEK